MISSDNRLIIDPAICKINDEYFVAYTCISGTVNNDNKEVENGLYEVILVKSVDLKNWEKLSTIVLSQSNIEDGSLYFDSTTGNLIFLYEDELLDMGKSSFFQKTSNNGGNSWSEAELILDSIADNEPAGYIFNSDRKYLFYSSDILNPGKSYYGAEAYMNETALGTDKNIILLDVVSHNDKLLLLAKRFYPNNGRGLALYQLQ